MIPWRRVGGGEEKPIKGVDIYLCRIVKNVQTLF